MSDGNEILYALKERSDESALVCKDPSKAVQADMIDADINTIVKRFGITGQLPSALNMPSYADYDGIFDFQSAQATILQAEEQFATIPAEIRARFMNSPQLFTEFAMDVSNIDEMVRLGLAIAKPVPPKEDPPKHTEST